MCHNDNPSKANVEGLSRFDEYAARLGKFNLASIYILIAKRESILNAKVTFDRSI